MNINIIKQRAKAFDYLFDAVVVTDLKGIIVDWNKGSEALYGYTKDEMIGRPVSRLHVPEDTASITSMVIEAVSQFGKWSGEIRMLHKDGHIGWIESMCVPIFDEQEKMIGALGINRNISKRIEESERLNYLAHYDQLTKVPNRYLLLERVNHLIEQCQRNNHSFALLYIDLNKFKKINDTCGHAFGDKVLVEAAARLKSAVRNSDTLARVGGDEFVLLLEDISNNDTIKQMTKKLSLAMKKTFVINDQSFDLSCSIGVSTYPKDGTNTDSLFAAADKAMYLAKNKERKIIVKS